MFKNVKIKTLNNITVLDLSNPETVQIIQAKFGKTDKAGWIFDGGGNVYFIHKRQGF